MDEDQIAQLVGGGAFAFLGVILLCALAVAAVTIVGMWKVFEKAGKPGWAVIVPIYNIIVMLEITGRPIWWVFLYLIPLVNFIFAIILYVDLAKSFGQGMGFAIGLMFLSFIFFPILGFGDAKYLGPAVTPTGPAVPI
ncbi:MAG: DUF5684 domain-containing protein [Bryobacteraceae bacterium]